MSITDVEICNKALYKIGAEKINRLGEDSKFGTICQDLFPLLRDEVQEAHPWTFCIEWIDLGALSGATHPVYGVGFQLPDRVLRPLQLDGHPDWRWENRTIYVSDKSCLVKCIVRVEDPGKFTPTFGEALACRIAMELAYSAANSVSLKNQMQNEYESAIGNARSFNSQSAGTPPRTPPRTNWTRGRGITRSRGY